MKDATATMNKVRKDYLKRQDKGGPNQKDIADALGVRTEYLNRIFGKLAKGVPVRMNNNSIEKLEAYAATI